MVNASLPSKALTSDQFLADVDPDLVMWSGFPPLVEEVRKTHNVDQVSAVSKLDAFLADRLSSETTVHTLPWTQAPSAHGRHDTSILITACHFARFRKNDEEVDLIRAACDLSSRAHEVLMRNISKGEHVSTEAEAEALFVQQCRRAGYGALPCCHAPCRQWRAAPSIKPTCPSSPTARTPLPCTMSRTRPLSGGFRRAPSSLSMRAARWTIIAPTLRGGLANRSL